jgi:phosphatidylglycerophosphate synthase
MGIYTTKSKWQQALRPAVELCVRARIHPDIFTYGALILSAGAAAAFALAESNHLWLWAAPPLLLVRLLLNLMDGQVARQLGLANAWGEVKNEFGDRLADAAIFGALGVASYTSGAMGIVLLALVLCTSFLGVLAKTLTGERMYGGIFGKGDRMISLALFTLYPAVSGQLGSFNLFLGIACAAALVTIGQRLFDLHVRTESVR